ncbi:MAG TPA: amidohydrolase family protein [Gaiellaceae bacterium]|nr:amidohydrolase family protein [Gaiellaceae bacterium]
MRLGVAAAVVDGVLLPGGLEIVGDLIGAAGLPGTGSGIAVPGFVDLQVNGFAGVEFLGTDVDGYRRAGAALLATGVTAFQPTLITAPETELVNALASLPTTGIGPRILGAHLEGPFLAPERLGAHPAAARRDPDPALLARLLAAGDVAQVTLAPELPGALELIELLHARGIVVSFGHSNATADEARLGFEQGVATVTHLFNAMRRFGHRDPGLAGAALADERIDVQLILDGVHLAEETELLVLKAAAGRIAVVTDAVAGATRRPDGVLAGGSSTMLESFRRLVSLGATIGEAAAATSSVAARIARRPDLGTLRPGGAADVLVLDDRLELERVVVAGVDAL